MKWFRRDKPVPGDVQWERLQTEVRAVEWERLQAEDRAAKQSRFEQTATQRDLVDAVSQILFRADPAGINFETNTDEYEAEAETIVIGLPNAHRPEDVQALTHETFVQWFDAGIAGPIDRYAEMASEIWDLWRRDRGQLGLSGQ
jgi:hypothetical protein